jgi:hypothetical protein
VSFQWNFGQAASLWMYRIIAARYAVIMVGNRRRGKGIGT